MLQNAKRQLLKLEKPLLLGLSGGPDSMCLFTLLLSCKKKFVVAHIDHGLQAGSSDIKEKIESLCSDHGIAFHSLRLENEAGKNLEERLRKKRLSFFQSVMEKEGIDTLMLGHQKDEEAETVIKRFFEGGTLLGLSGMKEKSVYEGINVIRPLLSTTKREVIDFLEEKGVWYHTDPTNFGTGNLRAKMRSKLLPMIEEEFGKKINTPVCDIAVQAQELQRYFERVFDSIEELRVDGPLGSFYPYKELDPYLVAQFIISKINAIKEERRLIMEWVSSKGIGSIESKRVYFEKEGIFILNQDPAFRRKVTTHLVSWEEFWREGNGLNHLFDYEGDEFNKKDLSEHFRVNRVPVCLRNLMPIPLNTIKKKIKIGST